MRVVVTGGGGFIGRAVIKKLAVGGVDVLALVRDPSKTPYLDQPHVTLQKSDLSDIAHPNWYATLTLCIQTNNNISDIIGRPDQAVRAKARTASESSRQRMTMTSCPW